MELPTHWPLIAPVAGRWYLVVVSIDPDEEEVTLYQQIKEKGLELENRTDRFIILAVAFK